MKSTTCTVCGTYFTSKSAKAKYCSLECRDQGQRAVRSAWLEKNPTYDRDRMREYRERLNR